MIYGTQIKNNVKDYYIVNFIAHVVLTCHKTIWQKGCIALYIMPWPEVNVFRCEVQLISSLSYEWNLILTYRTVFLFIKRTKCLFNKNNCTFQLINKRMQNFTWISFLHQPAMWWFTHETTISAIHTYWFSPFLIIKNRQRADCRTSSQFWGHRILK